MKRMFIGFVVVITFLVFFVIYTKNSESRGLAELAIFSQLNIPKDTIVLFSSDRKGERETPPDFHQWVLYIPSGFSLSEQSIQFDDIVYVPPETTRKTIQIFTPNNYIPEGENAIFVHWGNNGLVFSAYILETSKGSYIEMVQSRH